MVCGAIRSASFSADAMAATDCMIRAQIEQGYAGLLAPGGSLSLALTLLLTLYVAVVGYRLILGQSRLSLAESVPHFIKLGVVLALVSSWPSYQATVVDLLFKGPTELANLIVARGAGTGGAPGEVLAALQQVFDRIADAAGDAWGQAAPVAASPVKGPVAPSGLGVPQFTAILLWASGAVMMAMSLGALLVARILLALLLLLGPLFIAAALFRGTRGLAEGWLRVTTKFALVPLFVLPLTAVMLAAVAPFAARLGDAPVDSVRDGPALPILLIVLVFAAVLVQATRIAGTVAAGIRLPRGLAVLEVAALAPQVLPPLAVPSRAVAIVEAIAASDYRTRLRTETLAITAGGRRGDTARAEPAVPGPRLGQSYRRLAVTGAR